VYGDSWRFETHVICSGKPTFRRNGTPNATPVSQQYTENGAIRLDHCEEERIALHRRGLGATHVPEQIEVGPSKNVSIRSVSYVAVWFRKGCDDDRLPTFRQLSITTCDVLCRYRENARWFQKVIAQSRGLDLAAEAIERAFKCKLKPGISGCYVISLDTNSGTRLD